MIIPSVPSIPSDIDPQLWQVLNAIKVNIDYVQTNPSTSNGVDQAQLAQAVSNAVAGVTIGAPGTPGATGATGATGAPAVSYVLDIADGRTSVIYDADGANPLPVMTPFTAVLYKDGIPVTVDILYNWYIAHPATSLLSGTSNFNSFTPTLASSFDATKPDNSVSLTVSADGRVFTAVEPVAITRIGATGSSASAVMIESTNGDEFRVGEGRETTLIAHVFQGGTDITAALSPAQFRWRRVSIVNGQPPNDDDTWNALYASGYKQITVSVDAVFSKATFFCDILSLI